MTLGACMTVKYNGYSYFLDRIFSFFFCNGVTHQAKLGLLRRTGILELRQGNIETKVVAEPPGAISDSRGSNKTEP